MIDLLLSLALILGILGSFVMCCWLAEVEKRVEALAEQLAEMWRRGE